MAHSHSKYIHTQWRITCGIHLCREPLREMYVTSMRYSMKACRLESNHDFAIGTYIGPPFSPEEDVPGCLYLFHLTLQAAIICKRSRKASEDSRCNRNGTEKKNVLVLRVTMFPQQIRGRSEKKETRCASGLIDFLSRSYTFRFASLLFSVCV